MAHLLRHEPWGVVDLDIARAHVFVREDWHYIWSAPSGVPKWTPDEQHAFHQAVDHAVWKLWCLRARIFVRSSSYQKYGRTDEIKWKLVGKPLTLSFDVRAVSGNGHWNVQVGKLDPRLEVKPHAQVLNEDQLIKFTSNDLLVDKAKRFLGDRPHPGFSIPAHEFGHTMGPPGWRGDEYIPESPYFKDEGSIMNVGTKLRARHLVFICNALRALIPGCSFTPMVPR
jgi:hypothetical protein